MWIISVYVCVCAQLYPALCDPMDCTPPGSAVHGFVQARTLERVAISSSGGSLLPKNRTHISCNSCIGRQILRLWFKSQHFHFSSSLSSLDMCIHMHTHMSKQAWVNQIRLPLGHLQRQVENEYKLSPLPINKSLSILAYLWFVSVDVLLINILEKSGTYVSLSGKLSQFPLQFLLWSAKHQFSQTT